MPQLHNYYYYIGSKFGATFISACSLGYHALRKREEGSGNIPILLLCKWNVVNVIFTTLWTATPVASNQNHENHRARANLMIIYVLARFKADREQVLHMAVTR